MLKKLWWTVVLLSLGSTSLAQSSDTQTPTKDTDNFFWNIEANMGGVYFKSALEDHRQDSFIEYLELGFTLELFYKGFFVQTNKRRTNPFDVEFGYQLHTTDKWGVDFITKTYLSGFSGEDIDSDLRERRLGTGHALRLTHFIDDAIFTVDLAVLTAALGTKSWLVESYYSYLIAHKNWEIYLGTGLTFYNAETVNYYAGIDEHDAATGLDLYRPGSGFEFVVEANAIYPLNEDWTLKLGASKSRFSSNIYQSPLGLRKGETLIKLGASYVF